MKRTKLSMYEKSPAQAGSVTPVIAFLQAPKRASSELTEKLQKFD
jgi:hypothetical protein